MRETVSALRAAVEARSVDELAVVMEEQELPPDLGLQPIPADSLEALTRLAATLREAGPAAAALRGTTTTGGAAPAPRLEPGAAQLLSRLGVLLAVQPVTDPGLDAYVWATRPYAARFDAGTADMPVAPADDQLAGSRAEVSLPASDHGCRLPDQLNGCDLLVIGVDGVWHALTLAPPAERAIK
ncbi:MAG: hypothetical protein AAGF32_05045 [Pseudomonadota bacterium]